jgi:hypothetical protein
MRNRQDKIESNNKNKMEHTVIQNKNKNKNKTNNNNNNNNNNNANTNRTLTEKNKSHYPLSILVGIPLVSALCSNPRKSVYDALYQ